MKISSHEQEAIKAVVAYGKRFGFGNLISHLKSAWAEDLMLTYGFTEQQGMEAAGGGGYSVQIHQDIRDNGEWDETGMRYRKQSKPKTKRPTKETSR